MADERTVRAAPSTSPEAGSTRPPRLSFRSRLTLALLFAAIVPLAVFGVVVLSFEVILGRQGADQTFAQILFFALAILLAFAIVAAFALATELLAPLRSVVDAVDRASKGDLSSPIQVVGDDELARLADSHNRLAADLERRKQ